MSTFIALKRSDGVDMLVNRDHIVKITQNNYGINMYVIHLLDGEKNGLELECGKKLWDSYYRNKTDKFYLNSASQQSFQQKIESDGKSL